MEQFTVDGLKCLMLFWAEGYNKPSFVVQYSILPTWIVVALLFLFSLSEYCSLHHLRLSFLFVTFPCLHGNVASNIFDKFSILCCKSSMAQLMIWSNLVRPMHCNGVFKRNSLFSVVHGEPNPLWWHFLKTSLFIVHGSSYKFLTSVGFAQACLN